MPYFSHQDLQLLAKATHLLSRASAAPLLADARLAECLLSLFRADFLGTTRWNPRARRYERPLCVNRDKAMSDRYEAYYQFVDPISEKLRSRRRATSIYEAIARPQLERTEYYTDFLLPNDLAEGVDLYLYAGDRIAGDFRVWRRPGAKPLGEREASLSNALRPYLLNRLVLQEAAEAAPADRLTVRLGANGALAGASPAMESLIAGMDAGEIASLTQRLRSFFPGCESYWAEQGIRIAAEADPQSGARAATTYHVLPGSPGAVTQREREVLALVVQGASDKEISRALGASYWTVRTHVASLMRKMNAKRRGELAHAAGRLEP